MSNVNFPAEISEEKMQVMFDEWYKEWKEQITGAEKSKRNKYYRLLQKFRSGLLRIRKVD